MINETDKNTDPLDDDFEDDVPFVDFESGKSEGSLGELFRSNPLVKVGTVLGVFVLIVGGLILFGGKRDAGPVSVIQGGESTLTETPGTNEVSPNIRNAYEEANRDAVEQAIKNEGSALPTPVNTPLDALSPPTQTATQEDPLERWRRIQEERQTREVTPAPAQPVGNPNADIIKGLAEAMARQMESVLTRNQPQPPLLKKITSTDYLERKAREQADLLARQGLNANGMPLQNMQGQQILDILVPAGTIEYAQLLTEANSDTPGPILAQIVSGPLSGSRVLGTFAVQDEYLVLSFSIVVVDGISYPMQGIAVDPKTTSTGMATDVDRRYFSRVVLPAAAAFIEGLGSAIADNGSTSVSVNGDTVIGESEDLDAREEAFKGVEEAASKIGDMLDDKASKTKIMVKVAAGTPMGILFIEPVAKRVQ